MSQKLFGTDGVRGRAGTPLSIRTRSGGWAQRW